MSTKQSTTDPTRDDRINELMIYHGYAEAQRHVAEDMFLIHDKFGWAPTFGRGCFPCIPGETHGGICLGTGYGPLIPGEETACPTLTDLAIDDTVQKTNIRANRRFQQMRCAACGAIFDQKRIADIAFKKAKEEAERAEAVKARSKAHADRTLAGVSNSLGSLAVHPSIGQQESAAREAQATQAAHAMDTTFGIVPRPAPLGTGASSSSSSSGLSFAAAVGQDLPAGAAKKM